jgi:hypothetical protein
MRDRWCQDIMHNNTQQNDTQFSDTTTRRQQSVEYTMLLFIVTNAILLSVVPFNVRLLFTQTKKID